MTVAHQASLSFTISQSLLRLMSIESVILSNHIILCRPLLFLPSIFPSIRVFSNESSLHIRWPKYWSFSFIISPSKENSGLISFRIDFPYLLVVHVTHNNLLQNRSSKASVLQCSAFFMVQKPGDKRRAGINWEIRIDIHTLLYIKYIINKNLLHSTRNSTQYSVNSI